jgi:hypothetical protein
LICNSIEYTYEEYKFRISDRKCYIPDFYIPSTNTIVEIKGRTDSEVLNQLEVQRELVESLGYNYNVIFGNKLWNTYYKDLLNLGCNIDESLDILHKDTKNRKINKSKNYIVWSIDNNHITMEGGDYND